MCRVLYLEDEADLVEVVQILLGQRGLEVIGTTSIPEALTWLAQQPFDIILLDVMMSPSEDMDREVVEYGRETGVEVARQMKAVRPEIPIVALTVTTDNDIRDRLRAAGVVHIADKPIEPEPLADTLLRYAHKKRPAASAVV